MSATVDEGQDPWSFGHLLDSQPDRVFLHTAAGPLRCRQLAEQWRPLVRDLRAQVAELGDHPREDEPVVVALRAEASLHSLLLLLAAWELGLAVAPLHPRLPESRVTELLERLQRRAPVLERLGTAKGVRLAPPRRPLPPATAAILFTSGSSNQPKGVVLTRQAMQAAARASQRHLGTTPEDTWLLSLPLAHIGGLSLLSRTLLGQASLALGEPAAGDEALLQTLVEGRVTFASCVPTQLRRWLDRGLGPLPRLRGLLVGGAPCPHAWLQEAWSRGIAALPTYGASETCAQLATLRPELVGKTEALQPLPGVQLRLSEGELLVRSPTLAHEYLEGPLPMTDDGFYRTGDLAELDADGAVRPKGRADCVILSGGEKISPERVESALQVVTGLQEVAVGALPDALWGQRVVVAVVGDAPTLPELRARLREALAPWELPRGLLRLTSLPKTPGGKLSRVALAALLADAQAQVELLQ